MMGLITGSIMLIDCLFGKEQELGKCRLL